MDALALLACAAAESTPTKQKQSTISAPLTMMRARGGSPSSFSSSSTGTAAGIPRPANSVDMLIGKRTNASQLTGAGVWADVDVSDNTHDRLGTASSLRPTSSVHSRKRRRSDVAAATAGAGSRPPMESPDGSPGSTSIMSTPAATFRRKRRLGVPTDFPKSSSSSSSSSSLSASPARVTQLSNVTKPNAAQCNVADEFKETKFHFGPHMMSLANINSNAAGASPVVWPLVSCSRRDGGINEKSGAKGVLHYCQFCRKGFRFTTNWRAHERTHTGEKLYLCTWAGCDKRFAHPASLQAHIAKHQGIKPYTCSQKGCAQKFANKSNLNRHMRRIHHVNTKGQKLPATVIAKMVKKRKKKK